MVVIPFMPKWLRSMCMDNLPRVWKETALIILECLIHLLVFWRIFL